MAGLYRRVPRPIRRRVALMLRALGGRMRSVGGTLYVRYEWAVDAPSRPPVVPTTSGARPVWVEVGASQGGSLNEAPADAIVYAFEPNTLLLPDLLRARPGVTVVAAAVTNTDGMATFHFASDPAAGSLRPIDAPYVERFLAAEAYEETHASPVPTVRLDTFMRASGLDRIDFLSVDAQGADLSVLESLGDRITDIRRIRVEAYLPGGSQYVNADNARDTVVAYLVERGFTLVNEHPIVFGTYVDLIFENTRA